MLQSIIEFSAVILLIYGFINEKKIVAFENRIFNELKRR